MFSLALNGHRKFPYEVAVMAVIECRSCGIRVNPETDICTKCGTAATQDPAGMKLILVLAAFTVLLDMLYFWLFSK
jgi:uncharacterized OB-fold protein